MAIDEALLESVCLGRSLPVLRCYQWQCPSLSFGYFQSLARAVNLDFCRRRGLVLVRRLTGGRCVLHDRELTYAVISPEKRPVFPGGIQGNYAAIAAVLQKCLRRFGINARLASGRERPADEPGDFRRNVCFHAPSLHELTFAGCKITGSAQVRRCGCFLQHGSLPLEMDLELLAGALNPGGFPGGVGRGAELAASVGWINRFAPSPVTVDGLRETLTRAVEELWGVKLGEEGVSAQEMERARELEQQKYSSDAWTCERLAEVV